MADLTDRRSFLQTAAGTGGILLLKPQTAFGYQANSALEIGIIGCGGRGNWIGGHFKEHTGTRIVALADAFADRLETTAGKFHVESARQFAGLDGYQRLVEPKIDAVAIESPPYFHPEHASAAVAAGKHVYLAKPVAVDVPGCETIQNLGEKVNGRLSFLVDFQTRARPVFQEAQQRIQQRRDRRAGDGAGLLSHRPAEAAGYRRASPPRRPGCATGSSTRSSPAT